MNVALVLAAGLSALAALLHVGIIIGGASWYRCFGAGERIATAAAAGRLYPTILTAGITAVLSLWAAYALSGAGVIRPLPLLKPTLCCITAIYLLRGCLLVPLLVFARSKVTLFLVWTSMVSTGYGIVHLVGLCQVWGGI